MSDSDFHPKSSQGSRGQLILSWIGGIGAILLFVLIVWIAYIRNPQPPVDAALVAQRELWLRETVAQGREKLSTYAVSDASIEEYRVPIELAMELVVRETQARTPAKP